MKTQNVMFVVLVVCLAVFVGTCWGDVIDSTKATAGQAADATKDATAPTVNAAKDATAPTVNAAKDAVAPTAEAAAEKTGSFASWALGKISNGLGFNKAPAPAPAA